MIHSFKTKNMQKILIFSIVVQCLCILIFGYSLKEIEKRAENSVKMLLDHSVEKIWDELNRNNVWMRTTIVSPNGYDTLFLQNEINRVNLLAEIQKDYTVLNELSQAEYHFFAYDKAGENFLEITAVKIPFSSYEGIRACVKRRMQEGMQNGKWYLMDTAEGKIVLAAWQYENFMFGAWIDESSLLSEMNSLALGEVVLEQKELSKPSFRDGFDNDSRVYLLSEEETDFQIKVSLNDSQGMDWLIFMQLLQFLLAVQMVIILAFLVRKLQKNFIRPMRNLTYILDRYQSQGTEEINGGLPESAVEDAGQILDRLGVQLERLQAKLYKNELERKQLEINFRNLQIRPHFFVNCLAMISGMADVNDVEKIQKMTVCLSEYYRYVLHDCMDMVPLWQEIHHMGNVVAVNSEWSSNTYHFTADLEEAVKEVKIPVLSVSTFLENSVKYGSGTVEIAMQASTAFVQEEAFLYIKIEDSGQGFPAELAENLNRGKPVQESEGKHIGINNVMQRMRLIYQGRERLHFSNGKLGGACVELWIPMDKWENKPEGPGA